MRRQIRVVSTYMSSSENVTERLQWLPVGTPVGFTSNMVMSSSLSLESINGMLLIRNKRQLARCGGIRHKPITWAVTV